MCDLSTTYLGLTLRNPVVASPSPLCESIENLRRMEDAGISAIVLHSLFEERIHLESTALHAHVSQGEESYAEALNYFPEHDSYNLSPDRYLEHIEVAKKAVKIPVIASLNGVSTGGWTSYARRMQDAGADALELNVYFVATDPDQSGADVEAMYADLVSAVCTTVNIPVAVKLGPYFSSIGHLARQLEKAGAKGLVMFNRFYQPDLDIESLEVVPNLVLSTSDALRLRLRWAAILYNRINCDIAITGGIHNGEDVIKAMMAGGNVAMTTSALLKYGIGHARAIISDVEAWMKEHEYESISMMRGSMSQQSVGDPAAFERANYLRVLSSYTRPMLGS